MSFGKEVIRKRFARASEEVLRRGAWPIKPREVRSSASFILK